MTVRHRLAVRDLVAALDEVVGDDGLVIPGVEIRVSTSLSQVRVPDIVMLRPVGLNLDALPVDPAHVVLVVDFVPDVYWESWDPDAYAGAGIDHYWRVRLLPTLTLETFRREMSLVTYSQTGFFHGGQVVRAPGLDEVTIELAARPAE